MRRPRKSTTRRGKRGKAQSAAEKRASVERAPSPTAWTQPDTTAELLLQRGEVMRQRFIAAAGTFGGTAPLASNATIALTIAKAEAQHAELLKHHRSRSDNCKAYGGKHYARSQSAAATDGAGS